MTAYTCPKGHASGTDDFCDTCGAEIGPNCGTPRTGTWRFCEDCGFDHTTGKVPVLDVPPTGPVTPVQRPVGRWTATVGPDRAYFEANAIEGVEYPVDAKSREVDLPAP